MHLCENIHLDILKKIDRYVKDIYKNIIVTYKHIDICIHTSNTYTFYVIKRQSRISKRIQCSMLY